MAITKLNSLAIPPDTIVESDLSYPLTNFSSTGIDDNASSTAVTIDASEQVGVGDTAPDVKLKIKGGTGTIEPQVTIESTAFNAGQGTALNFSRAGFTQPIQARISAVDNGAAGSNFIFSTKVDGTAGALTERMRIDTSGNIRVGTGAPSAKLHVTGDNLGSTQYDKSQLGWFHNYNGNVSYLEIFGFRTSAGSDWTSAATRIEQRIDSTSQSYIQFNGTGNTYGMSFGAGSGVSNADSEDIIERCRITSGGHFLIGLTSAVGSSSNTNQGITLAPSYAWFGHNDAVYIQRPNGVAGNVLAFYRGSQYCGSVSVSGSTTSFNTSSDYRLKENVVSLDGALDRIRQIPVRRFNFISDPDKTVDGFLAHEVADVVPEAITGEKDGMKTEEYEITPAVLDDMGNTIEDAVMGTREVPDYQGIDQSKLVPLLTKAIQEQQAMIETLQAEVTALKEAP